MTHIDSGHSSGEVSPLPVANTTEDCLIPFIADTAEKIQDVFEEIRSETKQLDELYGRVHEVVKSYAVNLDDDNKATLVNAKAMNPHELQQLLYLEIVKNRSKDREIGRLQVVEERLTLVETLFHKQSNCLVTLETEFNNALLALSEKELYRIEGFRELEQKFQEQTKLLSTFRKDMKQTKTSAIPLSENKLRPTTPESELHRTIETLKKSMKQREEQAKLKESQMEDEIERREAKIKHLEFVWKNEMERGLKLLDQRRSHVPNIDVIIAEEKRRLEDEYRLNMAQYKSKLDSEQRMYQTEFDKVLNKERMTTERLREDRNKFAVLYGDVKGRLAVIESDHKISRKPSLSNTSTTNMSGSSEALSWLNLKHLQQSSPKEKETEKPRPPQPLPREKLQSKPVAKVAGTPTKGLDNCQLCDATFDHDGNKENVQPSRNGGVLSREVLKPEVNEHLSKKPCELGKDKEKADHKKAYQVHAPSRDQPTSYSPFSLFRRRSKSTQQYTQTEQNSKTSAKDPSKHVKILGVQPIMPLNSDRYSPANVRLESKQQPTHQPSTSYDDAKSTILKK